MQIFVAHNSIPLVIPPEVKFRFVFNSPIFSEEGSVSFPFDIPVAENQAALGWIEKLNITANMPGRNLTPAGFAEDNRSAVKVPVYFDTAVFNHKNGYLFVTPNNLTYSCSLVLGEGRLNNEVTGKLISELCSITVNMGNNVNDFITNANSLITKSFPDADFNLPMMMCEQPYTNETMNEVFRFVNFFKWYDASPSFQLNDLFSILPNPIPGFPDITLPTINNYTCYAPCSFIFSVLKNIFTKLGYYSTGAVFSDAQINQLMFINNKTIDLPQSLYLGDLVKVRNIADDIVDPHETAPSIFKWDNGPDNIDPYTPPFQNPIFDATEEGVIRILDDDNLYNFIREENAVLQFHYKLYLQNPSGNGQSLTFRIGIWKYLGDSIFSTEPWMSKESDITLAEGESITKEGVFNIPCTPGMSRFGLGIKYNPNPANFYVSIRMLSNSLLDCIFISDTQCVKPSLSFNLNEYLPEITLKTLLDDLKYTAGIIPFIDRDNVEISLFKDIYNSSPSLDLTEYLLADYEKANTNKIKSISFPSGFDDTELSYITSNSFAYSTITGALQMFLPCGHYYRNDHDEYYNFTWARHFQDLNKINFDAEDGQDISITAGLPELNFTGNDGSNWLPIIELQNVISPYNDDSATPDYKIAFWRGKINDSSWKSYPFATPWVYKVGSVVITGKNTQLRFSGDYGLHTRYLSDFISMMNSENNIIKIEMDLPKNILRQLKMSETYTVAGLKVILKSIDFEVDAEDKIIQPVTVEVVKL